MASEHSLASSQKQLALDSSHSNSYVYRAGNRLLKYVEKRCKELGIDFQTEENQEPDAKRRKVNGNSVENGDMEHSDDDEQMSKS